MRNLISALAWIGVAFSIVILILTLLTTYQFAYFQYFNSYYVLQYALFITMFLWAIKMYDRKSIYKNSLNAIVCIILAFSSIFFMFMNVR